AACVLEPTFHIVNAIDQRIELDEFRLRQGAPSFGRPRLVVEAEEQPPDFCERESGLTRALTDRETLEHGVIVAAAAAGADRWVVGTMGCSSRRREVVTWSATTRNR